MPRGMKKPERKLRSRLDYEERVIIEDRLNHGYSLADIACELHRSVSTIGREVKARSGVQKSLKNDCLYKKECTRRHVCGKTNCNMICAHSNNKCICKKFCKDYAQTLCPKLTKPPYVCNGCKQKNFCRDEKHIYHASEAEKDAVYIRHETHAGFDLTNEQFLAIDEMVTPMIRNGCSVYHVKKTLGDKLMVSESTLRRLIDKGELTARNIDLRNKVKLRPRRRRVMKNEQALTIRKIGRLWKDYLAYIADHDDVCVVQMDCVEGSKTSNKVLLTLHWIDIGFQIALLMPQHTADNVVAMLDSLEIALGTDLFMQLFPVILTDNGTEFTAIEDMERSYFDHSKKRTMLFFCEPNMANEKGACENNHKYIRYIIPKGTDLDQFTQADINLCMSHVNSFKRKKVLGNSPIAMAKASFPQVFFDVTQIKEINATEIVLLPSLLNLTMNAEGRYVKS